MVKNFPPIIAALILALGFSIYMTLYTSGLIWSKSIELLPMFDSFNPGETARHILSLLGDSPLDSPRYMPTQGCETLRYETAGGGVLILYYCGRGLDMATYYPGPERVMKVEATEVFTDLGGVGYLVERGEGSVYETLRVYQRVGDVKVLQTGVQVLREKGTGIVRKLVIYPLYDLHGIMMGLPPPNPRPLVDVMEGMGLSDWDFRLVGALVCGSSMGYLYVIHHDGWSYPMYAEALVDVSAARVLYMNFIHEYGVDRVIQSTCQ